jgi:GPH family glycoside/pentoside/hexuronide:cation symporter
MPVVKFPFRKQLAYTCGMIGWSMMTNTIIVMLPYFYLPPSNSGLKPFVPQLLLFGVVNILSLIAASGRFVDAVYDPLIASFSDKSTHKQGRRIPFMKWAILPAVFFFCLTFYPLIQGESMTNAYWLAVNMICFFMGATTYIIPYNALLPELTETAAEKVKLSSFQQVGIYYRHHLLGMYK